MEESHTLNIVAQKPLILAPSFSPPCRVAVLLRLIHLYPTREHPARLRAQSRVKPLSQTWLRRALWPSLDHNLEYRCPPSSQNPTLGRATTACQVAPCTLSNPCRRSYHLEIIQQPHCTAEFGTAYLSRVPISPPIVARLTVRDPSGNSVVPCVILTCGRSTK